VPAEERLGVVGPEAAQQQPLGLEDDVSAQ
jgi:hypothetical protein